MRYYKLENRASGLVLGVYLADSEADAIEAMCRNAGYRSSEDALSVLGASRDDAEILVTPLWAVGDRVEGGDTPADYDTGTVLAIGEAVYEHQPWTRERGIMAPVLVGWDQGVRTVEDALDLREEGEAPVEREEAATA